VSTPDGAAGIAGAASSAVFERLRCGEGSFAVPGLRLPRPGDSAPESVPAPESEPAPESRPAEGAAGPRLTREPRVGAVFADSDDDAPFEASEVDPADPVVSANAFGSAATPEPTPNATANAPTRPTNRA
jgi:hypothetical protein